MECLLYSELQLNQHHQYIKHQKTVNLKTKENDDISIEGRHDPCITLRAVPVIEAVCGNCCILDIISR